MLRLLVITFVLASAACDADPAMPPLAGQPDGGRTDGGKIDGGRTKDEAPTTRTERDASPYAACGSEEVSNVAAPVTVVEVAGDPPTPLGGSIVDGTYITTSSLYTGELPAAGPTADMERTTTRIAAPALDSISEGDDRIKRSTFTLSGTKLVLRACASGKEPSEIGYTATPTTLTLYVPNGSAGTRAFVLERQ